MKKDSKVLREKLEYQSPQFEIISFSTEYRVTTSLGLENFGGWLDAWD